MLLVTEDPGAAADFYAAALGLVEQFRDGDRWIQFAAGPMSFALATPAEAAAPAGTVVPVFDVADLDTALRAALAGGARLRERRDMGAHGDLALLAEPAGATIAFLCKARTSDYVSDR